MMQRPAKGKAALLPRHAFAIRTRRPGAPVGANGPRGGVVTQRTANPYTPVRFRAWPPTQKLAARMGWRAFVAIGAMRNGPASHCGLAKASLWMHGVEVVEADGLDE